MRARARFDDPEVELVDVLDVLLVDVDCVVVVAMPDDWTPDESTLVQVAWDATQTIEQVVAFCTMRVSVWGATTSAVKDLALLVQGLLLEQPSARPLAGPFPARDPNTRAEVASFTVRWSTRSTTIP
jgi:hypothetical protein